MTEAGGGRLRRLGRARRTPSPPRSRRASSTTSTTASPIGCGSSASSHGSRRRLPEARDVRGQLRRPGADLQELRLPPRPAGQRRLPARHDHAPRHERPAGLSGHGLDLRRRSRRCTPRPGSAPTAASRSPWSTTRRASRCAPRAGTSRRHYRVTFAVPELADDAEPDLRSLPHQPRGRRRSAARPLELTDGRATVEVRSLELITLVAQEPAS